MGKLDYEYLYYLFDPRKVVLGSRKLNDAVCDYVIYSNIHDELLVNDERRQADLRSILNWIKRKRYGRRNFSYLHLAIFKATEKLHQ